MCNNKFIWFNSIAGHRCDCIQNGKQNDTRSNLFRIEKNWNKNLFDLSFISLSISISLSLYFLFVCLSQNLIKKKFIQKVRWMIYYNIIKSHLIFDFVIGHKKKQKLELIVFEHFYKNFFLICVKFVIGFVSLLLPLIFFIENLHV